MIRMVVFLSLSCLEDILQLNIWWRMEYHGLNFGITMDEGFIF